MVSSRLMLLYQIAHQVALATEAAGKHNPNGLLTSADLARLLNADRDVVKKALRVLHEYELICPMGMNPKHYRFDTYQFKQMEAQLDAFEGEDDELFALLTWLIEGPPAEAMETTPPAYRRKRKKF